LDAKFELDVRAILVCVALTALLANAAGWFASVRILGQKPLEVLREE
jgi:putative ABC transport system permease protein